MQVANTHSAALERAFQHARSGRYITIYEIRRQLVSEGYSLTTIAGQTIQRQLITLIRAARTPGDVMYGEGLTHAGPGAVDSPLTP